MIYLIPLNINIDKFGTSIVYKIVGFGLDFEVKDAEEKTQQQN